MIAVFKSRGEISIWESMVLFVSIALILFMVQQLPFYLSLFLTAVSCLGWIVYLRPMFGVHLASVILPIHSIYFFVLALWSTPVTIKNYVLNITDVQHFTGYNGHFFPLKIYLFQILAILIIPICMKLCQQNKHVRGLRNLFKNQLNHQERWLIFFLIAFEIWSLISLLWVPYREGSAYGLFRFSCNFVLILFLVQTLRSYNSVIQVITVYFAIAIIHGILAAISTWHAFGTFLPIFGHENLSVRLYTSLVNSGPKYSLSGVAMGTGHGLSAKHELGMYLITAIFFAFLIYRHHKSFIIRLLIVSGILFLTIVLYRGPIKTIILGSFFVIVAMTLMLPQIRKALFFIFTIMLLVNILGFAGSGLLRADYKTAMGQTTGNIKNWDTSSEYSLGTMAFRKGSWRNAIKRIIETKGIGAGADNLSRDQTFLYIHSHNIILDLIYDFGIPGFLFIFLFIIFLILPGWKRITSRSRSKDDLWWMQVCLLGAIFTCLLDHFIDDWIWHPQIWFLLGLFWAVTKIEITELSLNSSLRIKAS